MKRRDRILTKPFREQDLLAPFNRPSSATAPRASCRGNWRICADVTIWLTPREREVMALVVRNAEQQIAAELGATEKTIKFHRGHIMHKMHAESLADLVPWPGI